MAYNKAFSSYANSQRGAIIAEFVVILPIISLIFFIALEINDRVSHQIQHTIATRNAYFNEPKKIAKLMQDQADLNLKEEDRKPLATVQALDALGNARDWFEVRDVHLNTKILVDGYDKDEVLRMRNELVNVELNKILPKLVKNGANSKGDNIYSGIAKVSQKIGQLNLDISRLKGVKWLELVDEKPTVLQSYYDSRNLDQSEHVKKIEDLGRQVSPNKPAWGAALNEQRYYRLIGFKDSGYADATYKSQVFIGYGFYLKPPGDKDNWAKAYKGSKAPLTFDYPQRFLADCMMYYYANGTCEPVNFMAVANQVIFNLAAVLKILETVGGGAFSEAMDLAMKQGLAAIEQQIQTMIQTKAEEAIANMNKVLDEKIEELIQRQNNLPYVERLKGLPDFNEAYQ